MTPTYQELQESNNRLAEERRMFSDRLAEIHGISLNTALTHYEAIRSIQAKFTEWNTPKQPEGESPAAGDGGNEE